MISCLLAGLAFSEEERGRLYLRGLLPPAVLSQEVQAERCMINIRSKSSDLERHSYLTSLQVFPITLLAGCSEVLHTHCIRQQPLANLPGT